MEECDRVGQSAGIRQQEIGDRTVLRLDFLRRRGGVRPKRDMRLVGERVIIRPLRRDDLDQMQAWPPFTGPMSASWNLYWNDAAEMDHWFMRRSHDPSYLVFAVTLKNGQVIGRLSLRHIHTGESAVLGIAFGSPWVSRGYGTEALSLLAPYYFDTLGFRVLLLDVAATNERAIRCYENCGFVHAGSRYQPVEPSEDLSFLQKPEFAEMNRHFQQRQGKYWVLFYDMKLERNEFEERVKATLRHKHMGAS
jgi:RimJ/RimL family protein N-acetyltransferase